MFFRIKNGYRPNFWPTFFCYHYIKLRSDEIQKVNRSLSIVLHDIRVFSIYRRIQSQPYCPTPIWSSSFLFFSRPSRPPYFGHPFKGPSCNYFAFKAVSVPIVGKKSFFESLGI